MEDAASRLFQNGFNARAQQGFGHRAADDDFPDDALPVDEERGRQGTQFVQPGGSAAGFEQYREGQAVFLDEWRHGGGIVLPGHVDGQHHEALVFVFFVHFLDGRHFGAAGRAPGSPQVDQHGLPAQVGQADSFAGGGLQCKIRRQEAPARRGDLSGGGCAAAVGTGKDPRQPGSQDEEIQRAASNWLHNFLF